jgi:hypothetical protein
VWTGVKMITQLHSLKSNIEILKERIAINIFLEEGKNTLAVLNQKFWIGRFTKKLPNLN